MTQPSTRTANLQILSSLKTNYNMTWISSQLGQASAIFVWILIRQRWCCSRLNNWLVCISLMNTHQPAYKWCLIRTNQNHSITWHRNRRKPEMEQWHSFQNIKVVQYSCCYQETQESCPSSCQETSNREPCFFVNRLQRYSLSSHS